MKKDWGHESVLTDKVLEAFGLAGVAPLNTQALSDLSYYRMTIIDATLGAAGHTLEFIKRGCFVLGIERDPEMLEVAKRRLIQACPPHLFEKVGPYKLVSGNFKDTSKIAEGNDLAEADGILFDLGIASNQLASDRGFSFQEESTPLDMRMNKDTQSVKALDLLNALPEDKLEKLFSVTMANSDANRLAKAVVRERRTNKFKEVKDLTVVLNETVKRGKKRSLHPATLPFLALRIAVNSELEDLRKALSDSFGVLAKKGRLAVISFHSGEDRIVKEFFKSKEKEGVGRLVTNDPIQPTDNEIKSNPRAKSAKMRVIEKI
ncbi:MAG: 16S rRNA (cytosine(1402)-N(4))-methyltransferase RsmH [Candidatus Woesebacteria bacterium]